MDQSKPVILGQEQITQERKDHFLEHLADVGRLGAASHRSGIPPSTVHKWRQNDDFFNEQVQDILDIYTDKAEEVLENIMLHGESEGARVQAAKEFLRHNNSRYGGAQEKPVQIIQLPERGMPVRAQPRPIGPQPPHNREDHS